MGRFWAGTVAAVTVKARRRTLNLMGEVYAEMREQEGGNRK